MVERCMAMDSSWRAGGVRRRQRGRGAAQLQRALVIAIPWVDEVTHLGIDGRHGPAVVVGGTYGGESWSHRGVGDDLVGSATFLRRVHRRSTIEPQSSAVCCEVVAVFGSLFLERQIAVSA